MTNHISSDEYPQSDQLNTALRLCVGAAHAAKAHSLSRPDQTYRDLCVALIGVAEAFAVLDSCVPSSAQADALTAWAEEFITRNSPRAGRRRLAALKPLLAQITSMTATIQQLQEKEVGA